MVERQTALKVGKNGMAILANGEEEVASGGKGKAGDVSTVGEGERVRFVADAMSLGPRGSKIAQT